MTEPKRLHVAFFPWLAFGHMIPFLELAKRIAQKGHKISFLSTPRNIQRLPKIPPNLSSNINFISLPLPQVDNLPPDAEATIDLPFDKIRYLRMAYDSLKDPLVQFLETSTPNWVIYDCFPYCIFGGLTFTFWASPSLAMIDGDDSRFHPEDFTVPPKWIPFPSKVAYRLHEAKRIPHRFEVDNSGILKHIFGSLVRSVMASSDIIAIRSCFELEADFLRLVRELHGKPVFPVGLLPPLTLDGNGDEDDTWLKIRDWLDKQEKGSVVYIAFGSEVDLSQNEFTELRKENCIERMQKRCRSYLQMKNYMTVILTNSLSFYKLTELGAPSPRLSNDSGWSLNYPPTGIFYKQLVGFYISPLFTMNEHKKLHIALFPWLAFGHIIPFLELAKLLAKREATTDIPTHKVPYLKKAYDNLQCPLLQFLETSTPDWIIYDFAPFWLPRITADLGISSAFFSIYGGWTLTFFGSSSAMINGDDLRTQPEDFTVPPNSIIEALYFGRALIMLPIALDQGLIARVFEEKKVGVEITRDEQDGSFTRDSVAESLRLVMVDKEGKEYRDAAKEMRELLADKDLHDRYVDRFVELLQHHRVTCNLN
ncbi:hypothetical protein JCGZ_18719 [Jatropha curcas]|uniref:Anthocyanidin 3-O-glucosyltransferase n=1 Tax=Jatropha curcas TaxID=180498 RepID=A0A067KD82_JATCU|nr:hypothetical protein JCGZ_18719 [Jatropha curcas]